MLWPRHIRSLLAANAAGLPFALPTICEQANEQPGYAPTSIKRRL